MQLSSTIRKSWRAAAMASAGAIVLMMSAQQVTAQIGSTVRRACLR